MTMEEKLLIMKESNVIAIIQSMKKMLTDKVIVDFDFNCQYFLEFDQILHLLQRHF